MMEYKEFKENLNKFKEEFVNYLIAYNGQEFLIEDLLSLLESTKLDFIDPLEFYNLLNTSGILEKTDEGYIIKEGLEENKIIELLN